MNHFKVEVNKEPEHVQEKINLRPELSESETGTSKFSFFSFCHYCNIPRHVILPNIAIYLPNFEFFSYVTLSNALKWLIKEHKFCVNNR